jgi:hypothetical protein
MNSENGVKSFDHGEMIMIRHETCFITQGSIIQTVTTSYLSGNMMPHSSVETATTSWDDQKAHADNGKILTLNTVNPNIKDSTKSLLSGGLMRARVNEIDRQLAEVRVS